MTGIGPVPVKVPRVRDRGVWRRQDHLHAIPSCRAICARRNQSRSCCPWLYLKGVSTGDFTEALEALLGPHAKGLSAKTVTRLKADWWKGLRGVGETRPWQPALSLRLGRMVFISNREWLKKNQCVLVIVGADEYGRKELLAMTDGFRESTQKLARGAARSQATWTETGPQTGHRRRCPGVLDRAARGVRYDAGAALLGP